MICNEIQNVYFQIIFSKEIEWKIGLNPATKIDKKWKIERGQKPSPFGKKFVSDISL